MAGKRKPPPPEPDSEEDSEAYSDEEGLGLEAGGAGGSDLEDEEEEEDAELEAEMAALESIRRDKLGGAGAPAKAHVYNKPGLEAAIEGTRTPPRPARGPSRRRPRGPSPARRERGACGIAR